MNTNSDLSARLHEMDDRMSAVEKAVAGQEAALIALSDNQRSTSNRLDQIGKDLGSKIDSLSSQGTNWAALASWAGVIVAITTYHTSITTQPIRDMIDLKSAVISAQVGGLDSTLQREMRLLTENQKTEISALRDRVKVLESQVATFMTTGSRKEDLFRLQDMIFEFHGKK